MEKMTKKLLSALGGAVSADQAATLHDYGFDLERFEGLARRLRCGDFGEDSNRIQGAVEAPAGADFIPWPGRDEKNQSRLREVGERAIAAGEVSLVVLAGGMATRFGGVVKGAVDVLPGRSFLDLKLSELRITAPNVPVFIMNSFATEAVCRKHLHERDFFGLQRSKVHLLRQRVSVRVRPQGEIYRSRQGALSLYASGHGDVFEVLAQSPEFAGFRAAGGRYAMISNVDNLAATLDPLIIGAHIESKKSVTMEVAPRQHGDRGGAPAWYNDRLQIIEGFRFPRDFDHEALPYFNTNTATIDAAVPRDDYPLSFFRADKRVDGDDVVQFERLLGEVTSFVDSAFVEVPRDGENGRFSPIKSQSDLDALRPYLQQRFARLDD